MRLLSWGKRDHGVEALKGEALLARAGYSVDSRAPDIEELRRLDPLPDAVVIDLSRAPSQGRDVALWMRQRKSSRHVPLVIAGGEPAKVAQLRALLPDVVCSPWSRIRSAVSEAIRLAASPQAKPPAVPPSVLAGYSGTPLPRKLGIKPGATVQLLGAPDGFERLLEPLAGGARITREPRARGDLTIWFARSSAELHRGMESRARALGRDGLWIAWPKQASGVSTDLREGEVRRTGLDAGLVDYKVCAVDATWSGLKFTRRRQR